MKNFRELNDDILKEWLEFREENILCYLNEEDKKHKLFIADNFLNQEESYAACCISYPP